MNGPRFSVIIPVFNKWELTAACLRSLREHTPEYAYEVIAVDNASSDATAARLGELGREYFGQHFQRIRFEENRNFGPACNAGARAANAPLLFFLNNDTLLSKGWAPPLLQALEERPDAAGVGPLLLYENKTVQHLGVVFSVNRVEHLYRHFPFEHPAARKPRICQAITAAAFMTTAELFMRQGGFYEAYRNGFEDVDFCLHASAQGKHFVCIPESVVYHLESQTPNRKQDDAHNAAILQERCGSLFRVDMHQHGMADGFEPGIDDFWEMRLGLTKADEEALLRAAEGKTADFWYALMGRHPFWRQGREVVAASLEKEGHYEQALPLRAYLASFLGTEQACTALLRTAVKAHNKEIAGHAQETLQRLLSVKRDRAVAQRLSGQALRLAGRDKDAMLAGLYREKMRELFF